METGALQIVFEKTYWTVAYSNKLLRCLILRRASVSWYLKTEVARAALVAGETDWLLLTADGRSSIYN